MRVAICTDQYLPLLSGVADSIASQRAELEKRGHAVRIYAPAMDGAEPDAGVMRLPQASIPGSGEALSIVWPRGMRADMEAFAPDVVHTQSTGIIGIVGARAASALGVPLVGTSHTLPAHYLHYFKLDFALAREAARKYTALYFQRCAIVSAPSHMMIDELRAYGMTKPARVISNQIETGLFRPLPDKKALKEKYGVASKAILLFGRIAKEKNVDVALEAFKALPSADAQLAVVGDGPARAAFVAQMRELGLEARVRMFGAKRGEELVEIMNACDAFMIASESETQSMTTLQAMACGLPAVAANAGALPEYVRDGENGFVVPAREPLAYAQKLESLLNDPALAKRFGESGREKALRYSPEKIVEQFELLYVDAIH